MADLEMTDNFKGDDQHLMSCIRALVNLDESGSLTSPLGGHARTLLEAACVRLAELSTMLMVACNDQALRQLFEDRDKLHAEVLILRKDSERLDWLGAKNAPFKMGWRCGIAPAGNVSLSSAIQLGGEITPIREAIDAAMGKGGQGNG
ncbi:hypothetical protein D9M70_449230 [compost metagenome]